MDKNAFTDAMDRMLGCSTEAVRACWGKAAMSFSGLKVYIRKGGCIAFAFTPSQEGNMTLVASGYVVYDNGGNVLHAQGVTPVKMDDAMLEGTQDLRGLAEKYGDPHADIGNSQPCFAYLSDHGTLYSVDPQDMTTCVIRELSLLQA